MPLVYQQNLVRWSNKQPPFKAAIWATKNVETQIRDKGLERPEVGEKKKFDGS